MEVGTLTVKLRSNIGSGFAKKTRRVGSIPAICYGGGKDPLALQVVPADLQKSLDPKKGRNTLLRLNVEGTKDQLTVLVKDAQRHPLRGDLVHVDFLRVQLDKPVKATVPLHLVGKAEGVKAGGQMHQVYRTIDLLCLPDKIPTHIDLDVTALNIGQSIHVADLKLPDGVKPALPGTVTLCVVTAIKEEKEKTATADGAAADGAAAAAAGDKAAASAKTPAPAAKGGGDKAAAAKPAAGGKK
ncbi:MAG TPA: 50S ribosomal protein L25 [Pseudomonadota bacterium]|nr:50S ribosomal protein L25 [Pseudomonadota bacterium]